MPNMSYCRFRNTAADLQDCIENLDAKLGEDENKARKRLIKKCVELLQGLGVEISDEITKDALLVVDELQG